MWQYGNYIHTLVPHKTCALECDIYLQFSHDNQNAA